MSAASTEAASSRVCLHYLLNKLQPLPFATPVVVTLNPAREPDPAKVLAEFDYAHPIFDGPAIAVEQLTAIKRAGADFILTYFAREIAEAAQ